MPDRRAIAKKLQGISPTPMLDALFFLQCNPNPTEEEIDSFVKRRQAKEPVSKIVQQKGFWNLILKTTRDTLDPRPDSETLIETVLQYYPDRKLPLSILDVGTGTGCLLLALLKCFLNSHGIGIDKSEKALEVAKENGQGFKADFCLADFTNPTSLQVLKQFDVIVSNPPYIPTKQISQLDESVRLYDPLLALDGGTDGLDAYRSLSKNLISYLTKEGKLFLEIGCGQEDFVKDIFTSNNWNFLSSMSDLGGIVRVLVFQRK